MNVQTKPLAEINQQALSILCKELGVVSTLRFINQFTIGYGNYTKERDKLFANMSLDELVTDIKLIRDKK